ncbi:hypothetical protein BROSI_A1330 [Candidatus Brocadia sinica JPN1]|uniref:Uncharacterized protein n=1 Tax=Candidatus Brocadia sinica JPN1 TaxID=1197129 RepID=A0ABQ0JVU4_9BACT|nr:hypothetical protein BROSI_A1330 [Candidatus Brocadia sinica JPN1]
MEAFESVKLLRQKVEMCIGRIIAEVWRENK